MKIALLSLLISLPQLAKAEYRVYQYIVKNKVSDPKDQKPGVIKTSTFDPVSYIAYHGGASLITVDLLRTWQCPGHTGKKTICESPYSKLTEEDIK